jgi:N utilization substance protein B
VTEPRDLALEALYEADQRELTEVGESLPPKAARMVAGVLRHVAELDADIDRASEHWRLARMPVVDRAILRLGLYELRYEQDTPIGVVMSEAVRLAKTYSTEKSSAFVNGVLAALAEKERSPAEEGGTNPAPDPSQS